MEAEQPGRLGAPLNLERALAALPHGESFRFVDRLTALEPGVAGTGEYRLPEQAAFLAGHFPGDPLMPGVLMIEALAQLAGVVAQSDPARAPLQGLKLTGVRQAKITGTIGPGETLQLEARIVARMGGLVQARGTVTAGGVVLVQAEVVLAGLDPGSAG